MIKYTYISTSNLNILFINGYNQQWMGKNLGEKMHANHRSDKRLISRIYEELQLKNKNQITQFTKIGKT